MLWMPAQCTLEMVLNSWRRTRMSLTSSSLTRPTQWVCEGIIHVLGIGVRYTKWDKLQWRLASRGHFVHWVVCLDRAGGGAVHGQLLHALEARPAGRRHRLLPRHVTIAWTQFLYRMMSCLTICLSINAWRVRCRRVPVAAHGPHRQSDSTQQEAVPIGGLRVHMHTHVPVGPDRHGSVQQGRWRRLCDAPPNINRGQGVLVLFGTGEA